MSKDELHVHTPDGKSVGPYSVDEVRNRAQAGTLPAGSQVYLDGEWRPVESLLEKEAPVPKLEKPKLGKGRRKQIWMAAACVLFLACVAGIYVYFTRVTAERICGRLKDANVAAKCIEGDAGVIMPARGVKSWQVFELLVGAEGVMGVVLVFESKADLVDAQEFYRGLNSKLMPVLPASYARRNPPFLIQMRARGEQHLPKIRALFEEDDE